jgi:hypothetical protein
MENLNHHPLWQRYPEDKIKRFNRWMNTPHGRQVFDMFKRFASTWREAGHDRCSASLITNRLRWECAVTAKYQGYKITNDYSPMMARQLVQDDPTFDGFFSFHNTNHLEGGK